MQRECEKHLNRLTLINYLVLCDTVSLHLLILLLVLISFLEMPHIQLHCQALLFAHL